MAIGFVPEGQYDSSQAEVPGVPRKMPRPSRTIAPILLKPGLTMTSTVPPGRSRFTWIPRHFVPWLLSGCPSGTKPFSHRPTLKMQIPRAGPRRICLAPVIRDRRAVGILNRPRTRTRPRTRSLKVTAGKVCLVSATETSSGCKKHRGRDGSRTMSESPKHLPFGPSRETAEESHRGWRHGAGCRGKPRLGWSLTLPAPGINSKDNGSCVRGRRETLY